MALFAKPAGGLQMGKRLFAPPRLIRLHLGAPGRILYITDLHLRRAHPEALENLIAACRDARPELIILGGDLTEYDGGLAAALRALREAFPNVSMYAVPGNNDDAVMGGDRAAQTRVYEEFACRYLTDRGETLLLNGRPVEIFGAEDAYSHAYRVKGHFSRPSAYHILISHAPHADLARAGADLMLCGHTHGGQINAFGITCYLLTRYEKRFRYACLAGRKRIGRTELVVSRGIGYSKFPLRVMARSEVYLID